jgi:hypothetical protein
MLGGTAVLAGTLGVLAPAAQGTTTIPYVHLAQLTSLDASQCCTGIAVNDSNQVLGYGTAVQTIVWPYVIYHTRAAFWPTPTTPTQENATGSSDSTPIALNAHGIIVYKVNVLFADHQVIKSPTQSWTLATNQHVVAINDNDQVLINVVSGSTTSAIQLWKNGTATTVTGCSGCTATALSNSGLITATSSAGLKVGRSGSFGTLAPLSGYASSQLTPRFVNDSGMVAAVTTTPAGAINAGTSSRVVFWSSPTAPAVEVRAAGSVATWLSGMNASGQLAGSSVDAAGLGHAMTWKAGVATVLPETNTSGNGQTNGAVGVDDAGQVVVNDYPTAYVWQNGTTTPLPLTTNDPYNRVSVDAMTPAGTVLGEEVESNPGFREFTVYHLPAAL